MASCGATWTTQCGGFRMACDLPRGHAGDHREKVVLRDSVEIWRARPDQVTFQRVYPQAVTE